MPLDSPQINDVQVAQLRDRLEQLRQQIETYSEPDGPIRAALLPSLQASVEVVEALIQDGQTEVADDLVGPISREVNRIIQRGY